VTLGARHSSGAIFSRVDKDARLESRAPRYLSVGSSLPRSQSPRRLIESVVNTITVAGASMIQGARVMYSRP